MKSDSKGSSSCFVPAGGQSEVENRGLRRAFSTWYAELHLNLVSEGSNELALEVKQSWHLAPIGCTQLHWQAKLHWHLAPNGLHRDLHWTSFGGKAALASGLKGAAAYCLGRLNAAGIWAARGCNAVPLGCMRVPQMPPTSSCAEFFQNQ